VQDGGGREPQFCEGEIAYGGIGYFQIARWWVGRYRIIRRVSSKGQKSRLEWVERQRGSILDRDNNNNTDIR
jgi:hypothetical protein